MPRSSKKTFTGDNDSVFEDIEEAFLILDENLRVVVANSAYKKLTLQPDVNIVGQKFNSVRNRFHSACVSTALEKAFLDPRDFILEDYNVESRCWLEYRTSRHPMGLAVIIFDVTEKKETELRIALENEQSSLLLEGLDCGVARLGLHGRWLSVNQRCFQMTGYENEELSKKYFWELFADRNIAADQEQLTALIRGEEGSIVGDRQLIRADGRKIWVSLKITLVRTTEGKPKFFAMVLDDIDARKEAEESLSYALEAAKMGNWDYDVNLDFTRRSPRFDQIFGYGKGLENWGYKEFLDHIHPIDKSRVARKFLASLNKAKDLSIECRIIGADHHIKWISLWGRPTLDTQNRVIRLAGLVSDISEDKRAEQELQLAKLAAEDASREKSYFLANMSHEIRTPLGTILGFTEMLKDSGLKEKDREEYLQIVMKSGKSLASIIDHILDLSKVEAGYLDIEKEFVDVREILDEIRDQLQPNADAKNLEFIFKVVNPLVCKIKTDPIRLRQILLNIIGNAIKFTEKGFVRVTTCFIPERNGEVKVIFSVSDSGQGLSPTEALRLFQPFTQADSSSTRKHGGTGLGLALSRKLARAMGGDLVLESSVKGEGSSFGLRIQGDLENPKLDKVNAARNLSLAPNLSMKDLTGVRILVADDSPENQRLFKHLLAKMGASIDLADNGAIAVDMAVSQDYDLVLMDMQMPELDGYKATMELRKRGVQLPVIALTAHAMRHDREKCLSSGCNEYLSKPVEPARLFSMVSQFVNANPLQPPATPNTFSTRL